MAVPAVRAAIGVIPARTISTNSPPLVPCAKTPASLPRAIVTPLRTASAKLSRIFGAIARAFAADSAEMVPASAIASTARAADSVGTSTVPARFIMARVGASRTISSSPGSTAGIARPSARKSPDSQTGPTTSTIVSGASGSTLRAGTIG